MTELEKAMKETAEAAIGMLKKSQMSLDFSAPNPHDHHKEYTRVNQSGTVSNIKAKGAPHPLQAEADKHRAEAARYDAEAKEHEKGTNHPNPTSARYSLRLQHEKEGMARHHKDKAEEIENQIAADKPAAKEVKPNANAIHEHYPWGRLTKVEGKGIRAVLHPEHQEAIGKLQDGDSTRFKDEQGIDWTAKRNGEHVELKAPSRVSGTALRVKHSDVAAEEADVSYDPQPGDDAPLKNPQERYESAKHQALLDGVHKVGNDLLQNPLMAKHHEEIKTMLGQLKANPHPKHAAAVASQLKDMAAASKPSKNAAKDLKAELESDDFGMTEKGGNGRVRMGKDGTVSVYDSYFTGGDAALDKHIKNWSPGGTYHNYFKDKGYNIEVTGTDKEHDSKVFGVKQGRLGHVAVHLKVIKP